jgi:hypothetical protein
MKYRLKKRHYLDDRLHRAGDVVDWPGPPSLSMEPIDEPARKAKAGYDADRKTRASSRSSIGWTPAMANHHWKQLTRPDPEGAGEGGEAAPPTANINIMGQPKRGRPRAAAATTATD